MPLLFASKSVSEALTWKVPVARQEYTPPPALPPLFKSAAGAKAMIRGRGWVVTAGTALMGQLQTPGEGRIIPTLYIEALLASTTGPGPIDNRLLIEFNASIPAHTAMQKAGAEFRARLASRRQSSPFANARLTIEDIAWLLSMSTQMANLWCANKQLPYTTVSGRKLILADDLLARCKWVLPTRV